MRGFPKSLNTKADYEYIRQNFSKDQWAPAWQALLDTRQDWFFDRYLDDSEEVELTESQKIVEAQDNDAEQKRSLYILKDIPTSKFNRLGFTVQEIEEALASA